MPTFLQKIRLALKGWNRRRDERDKEFLAKNAAWGPTARHAGDPSLRSGSGKAATLDLEGLTVAYLDNSGRTTYYLDTQSGDVIEATNAQLDSVRYRPLPNQTAGDAERDAFINSLDDVAAREKLKRAADFRAALATDRTLEKAWYNFRNDRAIAAIERWLHEIGIR